MQKKRDLVELANEAIQGNYFPKVVKLAQSLPKGVHLAQVLHDEWCDRLSGKGRCNCNPDVVEVVDEDEQN